MQIVSNLPIIFGIVFIALVIGCFQFGIIGKISKSLLCALILTPLGLVGYIMLTIKFYSHGLWLSLVICIGIFLIFICLIWKPFKPKIRKFVMLGLAAVIVVSPGAVFGVKTVRDSMTIESGEFVDLRDYEPFRENTRVKFLDEPSSLSFEDNLPRLDGATALYPLYSAFANATYPPADYDVYGKKSGSAVVCTTTAYAFNNLLDGYADIVFLSDISEQQRAAAKARGLELNFTPIGKEAFVFFVNKRNSATNLTVEDIQGIYSGKITNWKEVGGKNNAIKAYQRSNGSGSQTALEYIMGDVKIMTPPKEDAFDFMGGIYRQVADYKNYKNSLGFSFLYYITEMIADNKVKLLSINGVEPSFESITNGTYPFAGDFYAVTVVREYETDIAKLRAENTQKLIDWILSAQGQELVEKTGYVPLSTK